MANRKVNITIETTANTSGAKQAEKALDDVSTAADAAAKKATAAQEREAKKAAEALEREAKKTATAQEREAKKAADAQERETRRRVRAEQKAARETEQAAAKVTKTVETEERKKTEAALRESAKRKKVAESEATSLNRLSTSGQAAGKSASRVGQLAGQAGFQVQDFAVQVGGGTSALTAFSQQAPQLLGAFGPGGAIIGAIVAVGAIAAKVFLGMGDNAKDAGERATEAGDKMLEAFEKAGGQKADDLISKIGQQTKLTDILKASAIALLEVQNSKIKSDAELAKSQSIATEEALKYLEATGKIKSAEEAIIALRKQGAKDAKDAAIAEIQAGVEAEKLKYEAIRAQKLGVQEDIDTANKRIDELQSREQKIIAQLAASRSMDKALRKEPGFESVATKSAEGRLAEVEAEIKGLFKFLDTVPNQISGITVAAVEQGTVIDKAVAQAKIDIETIESQFDITGKTEAIKAATTAIGEGAKTIGEEIAKFEPIGAIQEEAKAKVSAAVADGIITAQEQREIGSSLQTLMGTLKTGQGATITSLQDLISLNNELVSKVAAQNAAIVNMRARINSLALPVR